MNAFNSTLINAPSEADIVCFQDYSFSRQEGLGVQVQRLMLGEEQVQYELSDGRTVRIHSLHAQEGEPKILINVLQPDSSRDFGAVEWTHNGAFVCPINWHNLGEEGASSQEDLVRQAVSDCQQLLDKLSQQPAIVHFSTHGDLRPFDSFEVRQDSGGQVTYVDGAVRAAAKRGYSAVVVNQGWGPASDREQPLHEGAIVSDSGIYYYPKVDAQLTDLRPKEQFTTDYCNNIADRTRNFLAQLDIDRVAMVAGHYVDGGVAAQRLAQILRCKGQEPKVTYTDHSNGAKRVQDRGFYPGALWRILSEMDILSDTKVSYLPASIQLRESAQNYYCQQSNEPQFSSEVRDAALQELKVYIGNPMQLGSGAEDFIRDAQSLIQVIEGDGSRKEVLAAFMQIVDHGEGKYREHINALKDPLWSLVTLVAPEEITSGPCVPAALDRSAFRPLEAGDKIPAHLKSRFPWLEEIESGSENLVCFFGRTDPAKNVDGVLQAARRLGEIVSDSGNALTTKFMFNITYPNASDSDTTRYADSCTALAGQANELFPELVGVHPGLKQSDLARVMRHASVLLQLQINEPFGMVAQQGGASGVPLVATRVAEAARLAVGSSREHGLQGLNVSAELRNSSLYGEMLIHENQGNLSLCSGGFLVGQEYPGESATESEKEQWQAAVVEAAALAVAFLTHPEMKEFRKEMGNNALINTTNAAKSWDQQLGEILEDCGLPAQATQPSDTSLSL